MSLKTQAWNKQTLAGNRFARLITQGPDVGRLRACARGAWSWDEFAQSLYRIVKRLEIRARTIIADRGQRVVERAHPGGRSFG